MKQDYLKLFVKRVALFIALLPFVWFAFIALSGLLIGEKFRNNLLYPFGGYGFLYHRLQQADTISKVDVLIIGSSRAYRGIDPRYFLQQKIEAFNLGSSLQTPIQSEYLLTRYIDRMKPRVVLYEVTSKTFSSDGIEGAIDVIANSKDFDLSLLKMALRTRDISVLNTLAYSFFDKKILGTRHPENDGRTEVDLYVDGGFVERLDPRYIGLEEFRQRNLPLERSQMKAFESSLAFLKKRNTEVILVQAPVLHEYYSSVSNQSEFNSYFSGHPTKGYFNFSDSTYNNRTLFYDHQHLNKIGVTRFNKELIKQILPHISRTAKKENKNFYPAKAEVYLSSTSSNMEITSASDSASTSLARNGLKSAMPLK